MGDSAWPQRPDQSPAGSRRDERPLHNIEAVCDSYPGKVFKGKVNFISNEAEFAPKNIQTREERLKLVYMIKSYLDNPAGDLKPGMPVDVTIVFSK